MTDNKALIYFRTLLTDTVNQFLRDKLIPYCNILYGSKHEGDNKAAERINGFGQSLQSTLDSRMSRLGISTSGLIVNNETLPELEILLKNPSITYKIIENELIQVAINSDYKELNSQLTENYRYLFEISWLNKSAGSINDRYNELISQYDLLQKEISEKDGELSGLKTYIASLEETIAKSNGQSRDKSVRRSGSLLDFDYRNMDSENIASHIAQIKETQSTLTIGELRAELYNLSVELESVNEMYQAKDEELRDYKVNLVKSETENKQLRKDNSDLNSELEHKISKCTRLEGAILLIRDKFVELNAQYRVLSGLLDEKSEKLSQKSKEYGELKREYDQKSKDLDNSNEELIELKAKLELSRNSIDQLTLSNDRMFLEVCNYQNIIHNIQTDERRYLRLFGKKKKEIQSLSQQYNHDKVMLASLEKTVEIQSKTIEQMESNLFISYDEIQRANQRAITAELESERKTEAVKKLRQKVETITSKATTILMIEHTTDSFNENE